MITIEELLQDAAYRKFFQRQPVVPDHLRRRGAKPWRFYAQLKTTRQWRHRDFGTYTEAFHFFREARPKILDGALASRSLAFNPPMTVVAVRGSYFVGPDGKRQQVTKYVPWRAVLPAHEDEHHWCPYCRRPTVFDYFTTHHALPPSRLGGIAIDPTVLRCTICGASERIVSLRD